MSPDGRTLLFSDGSTAVGVDYALCLRKTDGSPVVRLGDGNAQALSLDGKWALSIVPTSPMRLTLYPTGAGEPRQLENGNIQAYDTAGFFPDGKRILACGSEAGQAARCYVQELAGGPPHPATPPGTTHGLISPDGNSILARDADGKFFVYPMTGGPPRPAPGTAPDDEVIHWSLDGRSVLIYRRAGKYPRGSSALICPLASECSSGSLRRLRGPEYSMSGTLPSVTTNGRMGIPSTGFFAASQA